MTKNKITIIDYFKYRFDNLMAVGPSIIIILLFAFSALLAFLFSVFAFLFSIGEGGRAFSSLGEAYWQSLMHVIDQGTITGESGWAYRFLMFPITILGLLLVSTLVGFVTSHIGQFFENLSKGRSIVLEQNHVVILGWSNKIFSVVEHLIKSYEGASIPPIVILAEKEKPKMEDEFKSKLGKKRYNQTKIICRTGNPIDLDDLEIINPHEAKSIIIIDDSNNSSDSSIIKAVIAIVNNPNRKKKLYHVVAELEDTSNREITSIVGGDEVMLVVSDDITARVAVQTCLQSGLSIIYNAMFDFENFEVVFLDVGKMDNVSNYEEAVLYYENALVIGVFRHNALIMLNPRPKARVRDKDKVLAIIPKNEKLRKIKNTRQNIKEDLFPVDFQSEPHIEKTLILGSNKHLDIIIQEMDNYLHEGSEITLVVEDDLLVGQFLEENISLKNLALNIKQGDVTKRKTLNSLDIHTFHNVMILGNVGFAKKYNLQEIDANTLVTLMHLRQIKEEKNANFTIVSEMLDVKNRVLAELAKPDDFIISEHILSLLITQLARNRNLELVLEELFDSQGSEIYLRPLHFYLNKAEEVDFYTLAISALKRKESVLGYRVGDLASEQDKNYGIVLNPNKSEKIKFKENDLLIVVAKD